MANGVEITDEREEKYDFSTPYGYIRTAIIVPEDSTIASFADLKGKTTANTLSSTYAELAEQYGAKTTGVDDLNQTIELLLAGRVDATLNAEVTYYDYKKQHPDTKLKIAALTDMLGALIRGTDYITTKMTGERKMATVDDMLPMLREWMEKDGYDAIFLATEDQDILDRMVKEFPGKIRVISQERRRVSDFKNTVTIAGIEKEEGAEKDYDAILEDDTVNYFYALYMHP